MAAPERKVCQILFNRGVETQGDAPWGASMGHLYNACEGEERCPHPFDWLGTLRLEGASERRHKGQRGQMRLASPPRGGNPELSRQHHCRRA